ncbi:MAG: PQQ-binding-like beta-propeller repeat protein [Planctomycetia bacterium]|nr:PQQ-binding-like beta-propeller repeat protein [Planctomycetia bacterium]
MAALLAVLLAGAALESHAADDAEPPVADDPADSPADSPADDDNGVFLPADRTKERQLDRARRLVDGGGWTDAAALIDELLAGDSDAFVQGGTISATRRSIRSEATRLLESIPPQGRDAYALLCRSRAERALAEAFDRNDSAAVIAVARRWFNTPAGRKAALVTAFEALEAGEPLAASVWIERLAASAEAAALEPTLTLMRAAAGRRAGDPAAADMLRAARRRVAGPVRVGGRDVLLSQDDGAAAEWLRAFDDAGAAARRPGDDWLQPRGNAARNAIVEAGRPLLVPRYRVPLTRHPEEARLLDKRRRGVAAAGDYAIPAATPLAINGTIVAHTQSGILAIDFETGKRLWLRSSFAPPSAASAVEGGLEPALARVFDDATSGGLSSGGRLVFAVESHPDALTPPPAGVIEGRFGRGDGGGWRGGNILTAHDITAKGTIRWRLPAAEAGAAPPAWYMAAPLVVGDDLFVLVEESGQLRLDVLEASSGTVRWSQPLADLDERQSAANPESFARRLAGLTPAFAAGVLVCPLGGGVVVAVDVAARTLLWAHHYPVSPAAAEPSAGMGRLRGVADGREEELSTRHHDSMPVIAGDRVLFAPYDSEQLICLGLRDGASAWREPVRGRWHLAGVVDGRVVIVGRDGVETLAADTGRRLWTRPHPAGSRPSGRGILTATSYFLPLDSPEVVEVAIADGSVVSRRAARGAVAPGNLVAYRGEIISHGVDAIEVYHQADPLESRIETAFRDRPDDAWASYWKGQLQLDGGDVAAGLARLRQSAGSAALRMPPGAIADALVFGMRRDFTEAARGWTEWPEPVVAASEVVRVAVDGFLVRGEFAAAWQACRGMLRADDGPQPLQMITDPSDPAIEVHPNRWVRGRLAELATRAPEQLRGEIAADLRQLVAEAAAEPAGARQIRRLQTVIDRLGSHAAASAAREALLAAIDRRAAAEGDLPRGLELRREFVQLNTDRPRPKSLPTDGPVIEGPPTDGPHAPAWPLGVVAVRSPRGERTHAADGVVSQIVSLPLLGSSEPVMNGIAVRYDTQQRRLLVCDGFGRRLTEPLPIDGARLTNGVPWLGQSSPIEPSVVGRLLFVRSDRGLVAFDIGAAAGEGRTIWRHSLRQERGWNRTLVRPAVGSGGRVARDGVVPLGRKITEPDDLGGPVSVQGVAARASGVLVPDGRMVSLVDPVSGHVLWERRGLPGVSDWICDDEFACGCTVDGRGSVVLSMNDGRLVHRVDLPHRRQRLASHGRRIVAIAPLDDGSVAERVRLDLVDAVDRESRPLGEFAGAARAASVGGDHLAVVEPGGGFTVFDLAAGGVAIRCELPGMTSRPQSLVVTAWSDRYLVFVGAGAGPAELPDDRAADETVFPLQDLLMAAGPPATTGGLVWAVGRTDGRLLWPVPATIARHSLPLAQPAALPVLLFSRQTVAAGTGRQHLSLLCLDKRTGHAILDEARIEVPQQLAAGCELVGNPEDHTITIRAANQTARPVVLQFTGEPMPPMPPFQAQARPPSSRRGMEGFERSQPADPDR